MYKIIRSFLFLFSPEITHHFSLRLIKFLGIIPGFLWCIRFFFQVKDQRLHRTVFGLRFENPIGLAAGFDKDAKFFNELSSFGFGFIEIGTVTPVPQIGNPRPRLFRLEGDSGLINRMGFNNDGLEAIIARLRRKRSKVIIGGNIGRNKDTLNKDALDDYKISFQKLFDFVDYFVVNVSSPNTPNLRDLQNKEPLVYLLRGLQEINNTKSKRKPILLKISPDLSESQLDDIIDVISESNIDGVIATNTTIKRNNLITDEDKIDNIGIGGLSGKPLHQRSTEIIRYLSYKSDKSFPIIGVGGIDCPQDALDKLDAGATLLQIYTGFIYHGPSLIKQINKSIIRE